MPFQLRCSIVSTSWKIDFQSADDDIDLKLEATKT